MYKRRLPKYFVHFQGEGEGCDYTIGCNHSLVPIRGNTKEEATDNARKEFERHGTGRIKSGTLLIVSNMTALPTEEWSSESLAKAKRKRKKAELKQHEEAAAKLRDELEE
jgi:hypothetical protein